MTTPAQRDLGSSHSFSRTASLLLVLCCVCTGCAPFLVKDIMPGTIGSNPRYLTASNGVVFFTASTLYQGSELWKSDGTPAGTL